MIKEESFDKRENISPHSYEDNPNRISLKSLGPKGMVRKSKTKHNESKFTIVEKFSNFENFESNLEQNFLNIESNLLKSDSKQIMDPRKSINYGFAFSCQDRGEEKKIANRFKN